MITVSFGACVAFALGSGAQQGVVKPFCIGVQPCLFGLQHKVAMLVAVNPPGAAAAVAMGKGDGPLKHIVLGNCGVWAGHAQQVAQLAHKALRGRQPAGGIALPALNEGGSGLLVGVVCSRGGC